MSVIRQQTPLSSEPPRHLSWQPMITRKKQRALDNLFRILFKQWYFLDLHAKRLLAGKIVEAVIADPKDWYKERVRLLAGRNLAEDDDPEDQPKTPRRTPKKADRAWYPGSEAKAARMARQRRQACQDLPATPSKGSRHNNVVPSIELVDREAEESQQPGTDPGNNAGAIQDGHLPPVQRTLFALPTPDTTPAPVTNEHTPDMDKHADNSVPDEDVNSLKAEIDKLHQHMDTTRQTLQSALLRPDIDGSEVQTINGKLAIVAKRLVALTDSYRSALNNDAWLVGEFEEDVGLDVSASE